MKQFWDVHLDVEQPCLQVGHGLLSQSQVPGDHVQGLVREEALVDRRHAGLAADVPHVERHRVLLCARTRREQSSLKGKGERVVNLPRLLRCCVLTLGVLQADDTDSYCTYLTTLGLSLSHSLAVFLSLRNVTALLHQCHRSLIFIAQFSTAVVFK